MEFRQRKLSANLQRLVESIMLYFNKPINYDNGRGPKKEHLEILPKTGVWRSRVNPITTSIFLLLHSFYRRDCHKSSKTIWAKIPKMGSGGVPYLGNPIFFHFFYWTTSLMLSKSGECLQKFSFVRKRGGGV